MKSIDVCGIGNAVVDILIDADEERFVPLKLERGTMRLVDSNEQKRLLQAVAQDNPVLVSGGSVANSIIALAQLGGKGGLIGCVGDDRYGLFYKEELSTLGVEVGNLINVGQMTGTSLIMVTPDAERTMRTCLAVSSELGAKHVDADRIARAQWLFIEGYVFANPEHGQGAIREAITAAKKAGTKIAITCSEAFVVEVFGDAVNQALADASLVFCNETEASALAGCKTPNAEEAFQKLASRLPSVVVTSGPKGAYVSFDGEQFHVEAFPCEPRDLTGAGDMFAGAFLYGITQGVSPRSAARGACFLASKVISQIGARLNSSVKDYWNEATRESD